MTQAIIQKLRRLEGLAIITPAHCIRAERYVERHLEVFSDATHMTVSQAVDLALQSAALTMSRLAADAEMGVVELRYPLYLQPGFTASSEIIKSINFTDNTELAMMLGGHGVLLAAL